MKKWRFLFWIVAIFFAVDMISIPFTDNLEVWSFASLIFSGISLIPIYGYAYQLVIGSKGIAISIFSINFLWVAASVVYGVYHIVTSFKLSGFIGISILFALLAIYIYPQFMYAFKSNHLWSKDA